MALDQQELQQLLEDAGYYGRRLQLVRKAISLPASVQFDLTRLPLNDQDIEIVLRAFGEKPAKGWGIADLFDEFLSRKAKEVPVKDLKLLQERLRAFGYSTPDMIPDGVWSPEWSAAFRRYESDVQDRVIAGEHLGSVSVRQALEGVMGFFLPTELARQFVGFAKGFVMQTPETLSRLGAAGGAGAGAVVGSMIAPGVGTLLGAIFGGAAGFVADLISRDESEKGYSPIRQFIDALTPVEEWGLHGPKFQAMLEDLGWVVAAASIVGGARMVAGVPTRFSAAMEQAEASKAVVGKLAQSLPTALRPIPVEKEQLLFSRIAGWVVGQFNKPLQARMIDWVRVHGLIAASNAPVWQALRQAYTGLVVTTGTAKLASIIPPQRTTIEEQIAKQKPLISDPIVSQIADFALFPLWPERIIPVKWSELLKASEKAMGETTAAPFLDIAVELTGKSREEARAWVVDLLGGPSKADMRAAFMRVQAGIDLEVSKAMAGQGLSKEMRKIVEINVRNKIVGDIMSDDYDLARNTVEELISRTTDPDGQRWFYGWLKQFEASQRGLKAFPNFIQAEDIRAEALSALQRGEVTLKPVGGPLTGKIKGFTPEGVSVGLKGKAVEDLGEYRLLQAQIREAESILKKLKARLNRAADPVKRKKIADDIKVYETDLERLKGELGQLSENVTKSRNYSLILVRDEVGELTRGDYMQAERALKDLWKEWQALQKSEGVTLAVEDELLFRFREWAAWASQRDAISEGFIDALMRGVPNKNLIRRILKEMKNLREMAPVEVRIPGYSERLEPLGYRFALASGQYLWTTDMARFADAVGLGEYGRLAWWADSLGLSPRIVSDQTMWGLKYQFIKYEVTEMLRRREIKIDADRVLDDVFERLRQMNDPAIQSVGTMLPLMRRAEKRGLIKWGTYTVDIRDLSVEDLQKAMEGLHYFKVPGEGTLNFLPDLALDLKKAIMRGAAWGLEFAPSTFLTGPQAWRELARVLRVAGLPGVADMFRAWRTMDAAKDLATDAFRGTKFSVLPIKELARSEARERVLQQFHQALGKTRVDPTYVPTFPLLVDSLSLNLWRGGFLEEPDDVWKMLDVAFAESPPPEARNWLFQLTDGKHVPASFEDALRKMFMEDAYKRLEEYFVKTAVPGKEFPAGVHASYAAQPTFRPGYRPPELQYRPVGGLARTIPDYTSILESFQLPMDARVRIATVVDALSRQYPTALRRLKEVRVGSDEEISRFHFFRRRIEIARKATATPEPLNPAPRKAIGDMSYEANFVHEFGHVLRDVMYDNAELEERFVQRAAEIFREAGYKIDTVPRRWGEIALAISESQDDINKLVNDVSSYVMENFLHRSKRLAGSEFFAELFTMGYLYRNDPQTPEYVRKFMDLVDEFFLEPTSKLKPHELFWFHESNSLAWNMWGLRVGKVGRFRAEDVLHSYYTPKWYENLLKDLDTRYGAGVREIPFIRVIKEGNKTRIEVDDDTVKRIAKEMWKRGKKNGGFTFDPYRMRFVNKAPGKYAVALLPGTTTTFPNLDKITEKDFVNGVRLFFKDKDVVELLRHRGTYVGGWADTQNGWFGLDPSELVDSLDDAMRYGAERRQMTIFDYSNYKEIEIPRENWEPVMIPPHLRKFWTSMPQERDRLLADLFLDIFAVTSMHAGVEQNVTRALSVMDAFLNDRPIPRTLMRWKQIGDRFEEVEPVLEGSVMHIAEILLGFGPREWMQDRGLFLDRNKIIQFADALKNPTGYRYLMGEGTTPPFDSRMYLVFFGKTAKEVQGSDFIRRFFEERGWDFNAFRTNEERLQKMRQWVVDTYLKPIAEDADAQLQKRFPGIGYHITPDVVMAYFWTKAKDVVRIRIELARQAGQADIMEELEAAVKTIRNYSGDLPQAIIDALNGKEGKDWDKIRRFLDALGFNKDEWKRVFGYSLMDQVAGHIKGMITMNDNGALMRFFATADVETFAHELGHLVRFLLPPDDLNRIAEIIGKPIASWGRAEEERFADMFVDYLRGRTLGVEEARPIMARIKGSLGELWKRLRGYAVYGVGTTKPSVAEILDKYFNDALSYIGAPSRELVEVAKKSPLKPAAAGAMIGAGVGLAEGDDRFEDALRGAVYGAVGGLTLRALSRRYYGYLPDALARLNTHLRYTLSPAFDAGRWMEQNMIAAMRYDLPPIIGDPERWLKARVDEFAPVTGLRNKLTEDNIVREAYDYWDQLMGAHGRFAVIDEIDRRLFQAGILGFSPRKWEAVQAFLLKQRGWTDEKVRDAVMRIGRYGPGRANLEKTINFVFFPFSFNKKLLETLEGWVTSAPLRGLLIHEGLRRYYESNFDEDVNNFLRDHLPILASLAYLNNLSMGIGPGRFFLEGLLDNRTLEAKAAQVLANFFIPAGGAATPLHHAVSNFTDLTINAFVPVVLTGESIDRAGGVKGVRDILRRYIPFIRDLSKFFEESWDQLISLPPLEGMSKEGQLVHYLDELEKFKGEVRPIAQSLGYKSPESFMASGSSLGRIYAIRYEQLRVDLAKKYPSAVQALSEIRVPGLTRERAMMDLYERRGGELSDAEKRILNLIEYERTWENLRDLGYASNEFMQMFVGNSIRDQALKHVDDPRFVELWDFFFADKYGPITRMVA